VHDQVAVELEGIVGRLHTHCPTKVMTRQANRSSCRKRR
jgi:hypothetical protein